MKTAVILLGVFVAFVAAEEESPLDELYSKSFLKCKESMNPSKEILELVEMNAYENNRKAQCFRACLSTEMGTLVGAKLDIERLQTLLQLSQNIPQESIQVTIGFMKECKPEAEVTSNKCKVMGNYLKCMKSKWGAKSAE